MTFKNYQRIFSIIISREKINETVEKDQPVNIPIFSLW